MNIIVDGLILALVAGAIALLTANAYLRKLAAATRAKAERETSYLTKRCSDIEQTYIDQARTLAAEREQRIRAEDQLRRKTAAWPARFALAGGMPEEEREEALRNTIDDRPIQAIMAELDAWIVQFCDRATDRPRELVNDGRNVTPAYTAEMRLHDAGGASVLAEFKARLQALTALRPEAINSSEK